MATIMAINCPDLQATNYPAQSVRYRSMLPTSIKAVLAQNLNSLMKQHPLLKDRFSLEKRSGVSARTIGSMKSGKGNPTLENIDAVARAYKLTPAEILSPSLKEQLAVPVKILAVAREIVSLPEEKQDLLLRIFGSAASNGDVEKAYGFPPPDERDPPTKP